MGFGSSSMWMMAASTAVKMYGQYQQGQQQQNYYNAQAQQTEFQSRQMALDAQMEREQGQVNADKVRKAAKSEKSRARAAVAAGGADVGAGTALKIDQEISQNSESDALSELLTGNRRGSRMDTEAAGLSNEANLQRTAGSNARTRSYYGMGSSLLASYGTTQQQGWIVNNAKSELY